MVIKGYNTKLHEIFWFRSPYLLVDYIAHIRTLEVSSYAIHTLEDHLRGTAELAGGFAANFGNEDWGRVLGLWHDLGKYSGVFQEYIRINSGYEGNGQKRPKTDHTSAAAILAKEVFHGLWPPLSYCIAGHHSGLHNWYPEANIPGDLQSRLQKGEFLESIRQSLPPCYLDQSINTLPAGKRVSPDQLHLWIRVLFSCLVDADYLDTERFMKPEVFVRRAAINTLEDLSPVFFHYMEKLGANAKDSPVNSSRKRILADCMKAGELEPGFFSITVPTGGGKTLSSMAWALKHALSFKKKRIIVVIPYTSIITQTAQVFRSIFGTNNVIEHHSNLNEQDDSHERKLAAENWDAPIIVTTNVQFFESLFSNRTSRCRKLHNLVNSIVILDEAQMLPPEFLKPIISVLSGLVDYFGASVMFSTATQPVLSGNIGGSGKKAFIGIPKGKIREIVDQGSASSMAFKRVAITMPEDLESHVTWEAMASELVQYDQVLCVVNTRNQCRELFSLLPKGSIHLSRLMCSAHISDTIAIIRHSLDNGHVVRVVSTQLIEAGVDIDFPVVYRALSGLDSIAQCAGRCNREGSLNKSGNLGQTKVFVPPGTSPPGLIRKGIDTTRELVACSKGDSKDWLSAENFRQYFDLFFGRIADFDKADIDQYLCQESGQMRFQFASAAKYFNLIDDKGATAILVEYREGADLLNHLRKIGPESWLMRKLQRYAVSLNQHDFNEIRRAGLIEQLHGCWVQSYQGLYSSIAGIVIGEDWLNEVNIV